ncbi:Protein of unknown function [Micromonospora echinaurantiaca]|uniref:DUF3152 domain-containing protein n=1 Tax=Micromonospora echinaurantiaca TaxID=47857 RepID=A0A1C5K7B8_9ACTN|nr:DUF3152 domain-containing protein [Micromonospora echinaurantiaca]SCG78511.1 Protein of unknown function [Micromonospora echinaurantiaca]
MTTKSTGRAHAIGAALLLSALLAGCGLPAAGQPPAPPAATGTAATATTAAPPPVTARPTAAAVSYPADGGNRWYGAAAEAPAPGGTGRLWRYRVAVERDIRGIPVAEFAAEVTRTLNDPQGWTAGGTLRLRRVGWGQPADFTIYLVTPGTRDELCGDVPDGYTSCRNGGRVVLNVARWVKGVPRYGASLATYRKYMVNHEVGHRLGMGHERCPGRGRPAPVMQQQTLGLHGCTANALPYLDGERYAGPSGAYDDPIPPRERGRAG